METSVLTYHPYLKNWVHPLHYRKTGAVLGAGRRISNLIKEISEVVEEIKSTVCLLKKERENKRNKDINKIRVFSYHLVW